MWLADWLYNVRFTYDWFYIIPLSFAILMLSFATAGYIAVFIIGMKKADRNTDRIVKSLDRIALSSAEVKEQLEKNREMLQNNHKTLDGLAKTLDWRKMWGWK